MEKDPVLASRLFFLTFGSQYAQEPHPYWDEAHPAGYVVISAPNETTARALAFGIFGRAWSMLYTHDEFYKGGEAQVEHWYPRGSLGGVFSNIGVSAIPREATT